MMPDLNTTRARNMLFRSRATASRMMIAAASVLACSKRANPGEVQDPHGPIAATSSITIEIPSGSSERSGR